MTEFAGLYERFSQSLTLDRSGETQVTLRGVRMHVNTDTEAGGIHTEGFTYMVSLSDFPDTGITKPEVNDTLTDGDEEFRVVTAELVRWRGQSISYRLIARS